LTSTDRLIFQTAVLRNESGRLAGAICAGFFCVACRNWHTERYSTNHLAIIKARPDKGDTTSHQISGKRANRCSGRASSLADTAGDLTQTATPLGDAQPFEYTPDAECGDTEQIAGMPFNGAPGAWASSMPGTMPQLRQYGPNGTPMTDIDFEAHHGNANPHAHNWDGTSRDQGWPVSILP
jgi:hypothetical protein